VKTNRWQQVLVFTRTKHGANRLAEQLEHDGVETAAIHGNKSQPQRTKALRRFKDCELQVLVATDIAARGIDIESLPHVVNYDLPHVPEDYVHRIGRTGRAGETGQAVSLVSGEDRTLLRDIERLIGKKIEQQVIPGFEPGAGYHSAQPEPQQRRGQRPQSQPRRPERSRSAQPRPAGPMRGSQAPSQPRPGQNRDQGRRQERQAAPTLPSEKAQRSVRQEQLEYHRHQQAAERGIEAAPVGERRKEKAVPALFGLVGRKVA
jgi:ATP-dependent RNA helicase RhlE